LPQPPALISRPGAGPSPNSRALRVGPTFSGGLPERILSHPFVRPRTNDEFFPRRRLRPRCSKADGSVRRLPGPAAASNRVRKRVSRLGTKSSSLERRVRDGNIEMARLLGRPIAQRTACSFQGKSSSRNLARGSAVSGQWSTRGSAAASRSRPAARRRVDLRWRQKVPARSPTILHRGFWVGPFPRVKDRKSSGGAEWGSGFGSRGPADPGRTASSSPSAFFFARRFCCARTGSSRRSPVGCFFRDGNRGSQGGNGEEPVLASGLRRGVPSYLGFPKPRSQEGGLKPVRRLDLRCSAEGPGRGSRGCGSAPRIPRG